MRASWLKAAMLGFLMGPAPLSEGTVSAESFELEDLQLEKSSGHAVRGIQFYVWDEDGRAAADWAAELKQAAREARAAAHWRSVAARCAALPSVLTDELEAELATWIRASASDASFSPLGLLLCLLPGLDRTCVISSMATSPDEATRRAVAAALSAPFEAVGVRGALEHLQQDPSAEVRRLAWAAADRRRAALA